MKRCLLLGRKVIINLESILKSRDITLPTKCPSSQSYSFSSGHVWMWELDREEGWGLKNWCFWTVVLEKSWESLGLQRDQAVHPKGNQSWIFIGRTDAEAEAPIFWSPDLKTWFIRKDPDAGKNWGQDDKRTTEDEMVGWHHWLNGLEFEQTQGDSDEQKSLVCCTSWVCVRHNLVTEQQQDEVMRAVPTDGISIKILILKRRRNTGTSPMAQW